MWFCALVDEIGDMVVAFLGGSINNKFHIYIYF